MERQHPPQPPQDPSGGASVPSTVTCYRHPDRPTRLSCSSCGKPICVDCTNPAAVGQKCPECAKPTGRNKIITSSQIRGRTALDGTPATKGILAVTVVIGILGFVAPQIWSPLAVRLIDNTQLVAAGQVWRTVTAALLHEPGSLFHIGFNMWALYVFGPGLERRFGSIPFLLFYLATAASGGLFFQVLSLGSALGASGAIFGLFGAHVAAAFLTRTTAVGRANLNQLLPLLALNLALPLFIPRIAWQAHVGGLVAGVAILLAWRGLEKARQGGGQGVDILGSTASSPALARSFVAGGVLVLCLGLLLLA